MPKPDAMQPLGFAPWERRSWSAALPIFLVISFGAHALSFFLFQALYPQKLSIPAQIPHVSLLTPSTPEAKALLAELDFDDPALAAKPAAVPAIGLAAIEYHPSFERMRTPARMPPDEAQAMAFPEARSPLELIESLTSRKATAGSVRAHAAAHMLLSGDLETRKLKGALTFLARGTEPLQSAEFLLGVGARGDVRYVFLQKSSGNSAADRHASEELALASFDPAEAPITWGFVTIAWGDYQ